MTLQNREEHENAFGSGLLEAWYNNNHKGGFMAKKQWPPCEICGKSVSTKEGVLVVYLKEIDQFQKERDAWERDHPFDDSGIRAISFPTNYPALVKWHHGHSKCLPEGFYYIPYSRFDTPAKALSWTLHLMGKRWLRSTHWSLAVRAHHTVSHTAH